MRIRFGRLTCGDEDGPSVAFHTIEIAKVNGQQAKLVEIVSRTRDRAQSKDRLCIVVEQWLAMMFTLNA